MIRKLGIMQYIIIMPLLIVMIGFIVLLSNHTSSEEQSETIRVQQENVDNQVELSLHSSFNINTDVKIMVYTLDENDYRYYCTIPQFNDNRNKKIMVKRGYLDNCVKERISVERK